MSMENYESIKSKVLKLRELALRGEHEEALNAQRRIDNILFKYNLSLDKILAYENKKKYRSFIIASFYDNHYQQRNS